MCKRKRKLFLALLTFLIPKQTQHEKLQIKVTNLKIYIKHIKAYEIPADYIDTYGDNSQERF